MPRFKAFRDSGYVKILILSAKAIGGGIPNGGNYTPTEKERGDDDATKTFFVVAMHAGKSGDRATLARAGAVVLRGRVTSLSERDANPLACRFAHRAYVLQHIESFF